MFEQKLEDFFRPFSDIYRKKIPKEADNTFLQWGGNCT